MTVNLGLLGLPVYLNWEEKGRSSCWHLPRPIPLRRLSLHSRKDAPALVLTTGEVFARACVSGV